MSACSSRTTFFLFYVSRNFLQFSSSSLFIYYCCTTTINCFRLQLMQDLLDRSIDGESGVIESLVFLVKSVLNIVCNRCKGACVFTMWLLYYIIDGLAKFHAYLNIRLNGIRFNTSSSKDVRLATHILPRRFFIEMIILDLQLFENANQTFSFYKHIQNKVII